MLHLLGEAGPQAWLKVEVCDWLTCCIALVAYVLQNRKAVKKLAVLFVPGVLPEHLGAQNFGTMNNANIPFSIPLPSSNPLQEGTNSQKVATVKTLFGGTKEITVENSDLAGKTKLPFVSRTFSHACPTRAPGDTTRMHSVLGAFFQGPVPPEERKRRAAQNGKGKSYLLLMFKYSDFLTESESRVYSATNPLRYVLTPAQLRDNDYPLPSYMNEASSDSSIMDDEDWYEMPKTEDSDASDSSKVADIFSIDCEMCLAGSSKELTRLSVVGYPSGEVLLDELVKPAAVITDYLTQYVDLYICDVCF